LDIGGLRGPGRTLPMSFDEAPPARTVGNGLFQNNGVDSADFAC
jgi:hypothetical protein